MALTETINTTCHARSHIKDSIGIQGRIQAIQAAIGSLALTLKIQLLTTIQVWHQ